MLETIFLWSVIGGSLLIIIFVVVYIEKGQFYFESDSFVLDSAIEAREVAKREVEKRLLYDSMIEVLDITDPICKYTKP